MHLHCEWARVTMMPKKQKKTQGIQGYWGNVWTIPSGHPVERCFPVGLNAASLAKVVSTHAVGAFDLHAVLQMEHLGPLVSLSISSNRWRYLACKWSRCLMGVCRKDEMHQGKDKWWYSHLDAYQCLLSLSRALHPPEGLSCKVDVSPGYSSMQGKRVIHWLILHLCLPCGVIQMAREPSRKASLEPSFQWCGPSSCSA